MHDASLGIRYQLTENYRVLRIFIPFLWLHVLVFVTYFAGLLVLIRDVVKQNDVVDLIVYEEAFNVAVTYALAHLAVAYIYQRSEKKHRARTIAINTVAPDNHQWTMHFDVLRESWN